MSCQVIVWKAQCSKFRSCYQGFSTSPTISKFHFLCWNRKKYEMSRLHPPKEFLYSKSNFVSLWFTTDGWKKLILSSFFLYFFLFLRVYFGEHELLPGGGCGFDSPSSQSHPSDRTAVQHHMKDQTIRNQNKLTLEPIRNVSKVQKSKIFHQTFSSILI